MADAAAVIRSVFEKLDCWLLQKPDLQNGDHDKLRRLRLKKKDLLVGMLQVWENDNGMLYWLLVEVADLWDVVLKKVDNEKLYSFVGEMEDLWEVNCRENLHTLLLEMMDPDIDRERLFSLAVETADVWKDSKGKLNKEKLYTLLSKKTDLWEQDKLFRLLEGMTSREALNERMTLLRRNCIEVKMVRNDLRWILDFVQKLEDEGSSHGHLHYFMSDVVEMAHHVQLLVHLEDSDPFILFLQFFRSSRVHIINISDKSLLEFYNEIRLFPQQFQEIKRRVLKFGGDVREELVDTSPTYSESDYPVVGLKKVVEMLLCNYRTTIRIQGLPGVGKTTLAREFYNHPEIVDGYECRAWVCVSSWKLSRKELLIKIIRQFIHSKRDDMVIEKMENKALRQMLHQHLQDKPYVLVLDDVSEVTNLGFVQYYADESSTYLLKYVFRVLPQGMNPESAYQTPGDNSPDQRVFQVPGGHCNRSPLGRPMEWASPSGRPQGNAPNAWGEPGRGINYTPSKMSRGQRYNRYADCGSGQICIT